MQAAGDEALAVFLADLPGVASVRVLELQALEGQAFVTEVPKSSKNASMASMIRLAAFTTEQAVPSGMTIFTVFKS